MSFFKAIANLLIREFLQFLFIYHCDTYPKFLLKILHDNLIIATYSQVLTHDSYQAFIKEWDVVYNPDQLFFYKLCLSAPYIIIFFQFIFHFHQPKQNDRLKDDTLHSDAFSQLFEFSLHNHPLQMLIVALGSLAV